jgi:hypothetical protein
MGLEPDLGDGVWSPRLWEAVCKPLPVGWKFDLTKTPELGVDCATGKGDDYHAIHGRWGAISVYHETSNVMDPARIFTRVKEAARLVADLANQHRPWTAALVKPKDIDIKLDDDGVGGAVGAFLRADGYHAYQIGAGCSANDPERYPRRRDELWFVTAEKAKQGLVNLSLLDRTTKARLRQQLLAPAWEPDPAGRRKVEKKEDTKEKIGRSPDDADAMNLAYYECSVGGITAVTPKGAHGPSGWGSRPA